MSRLGKLPIELLDGTQAKVEGDFIIIKGPKGELKEKINDKVIIDIKDKEIIVSVKNPKDKQDKSLWGLFRSLINNMVVGVTEGFEKKLEINGVGYRAAVVGRKLTLNVGFSHPVEKEMPEGINASVEGNVITIFGIDKQLVGEVTAQIRRVRKPEPYKGKGIKYIDEVIRRKAGKSAVKGE
ncbi:50S ribosomal protein L6 [Candidatus Falkowbacteria bacterium CG11_big_fil_rev_8_21_14_0_20_39_10]|uniref:Large ribosomal subunit protein uL6 n=1 Tax=Candidatus Falkowbacteria bacterium CG11_big_fil_rev_8_21_14_0_20_39_10 TaxID=1974570 RepID=A0A2M6K942_9BACT|nr:MAG: 50S ribosomal protein L6 [Candidatus Falkowbacteria bacterium CG11_big_fil_rev_8_21_14_0_20_39_10]